MDLKLNISLKAVLFHLILFLLIFFVDSATVLVPIFLVTILFLYFKKRYASFLIAGVYGLCMGSEAVYYIYSLVVFAIVLFDGKGVKGNGDFSSVKKYFSYFLLYISVIYGIQLITNGSILSFPFFLITFVSPIVIFFFIARISLDNNGFNFIFNNLLVIAVAQIVIAIFLEAIPIGISAILERPTLGDQILGTTNSAPALSILIIFSILPFLMGIRINDKNLLNKKNIMIIFFAALIVFSVVLNDSKTQLYALILAAMVLFFLKKILLHKNKIITIFLIISSFALVTLFSAIIIAKVDNTLVQYDEYINGKYNSKFVYYSHTFSPDTRPLLEYILGTGPGTNGSRASNALAYDVLYKKKNTFTVPSFIPASSSDFTKKYISKLYEAEYADQSNYRSAILGNPFNSFCAMFIEFGFIGVIIFSLFFGRIIKILLGYNTIISNVAVFLIFSNIITSLLDQTFENTMAMHMMYLLTGIAFINNRYIKKVQQI